MTVSSAEAHEHQRWALFDACLELDDAARAKLLAQQTDQALVLDVQRLLRADAASQPLTGAAGLALAQALAPPPDIEGFTLLRRLGSGGFGAVYLAMQHSPSRRVALKVLHAANADPLAAERFRVEADALALLAHPQVPKVFAVGETAGRRWLAMELVRGEPLDAWSSTQQLRRRVEALESVARVVHLAHLRGLVHRDLKPDNVLVSREGTPRVLDFGIAQNVGEAAPAAGTRAYMSPEQRLGAAVDGRADVYALGVMLRELASQPRTPRVRTSRAARTTAVAAAPGPTTEQPPAEVAITPDAHAPAPAELQSIAARATAALGERYASAEAFADDLARFLRGARVHAHPATWGYRLRCGFRQHRALVLGLTLLVTGLGATALVFRAQYQTAELERARADATRAFLRATLVQANPLSGSGPRVTVVEAVDAAAKRLDERAVTMSPAVELDLRETLATTYASLGREVDAWQQSRRAVNALARLERSDPELEARLLRSGADYGAHAGEFGEALAWLTREGALEATHARPHPHLAEHAHILGEVLMDVGRFAEATSVLAEAHQQLEVLHRAGRVDAETYTSTLNGHGHALCAMGRFAEARAQYELALQIDSREQANSPLELATDLHNLAWLALKEGQFERALETSARARALRLEGLGPRHLRVGLLRLLDGEALAKLGRCPEAMQQVEEGASILEDALGRESSRALRANIAVAHVELLCGRDPLARLRPAVAQLAARMGPDQWWVLEGRLTEAEALLATGQPAAGRDLAKQVLPTLEAQLGPDAPLTHRARAAAAVE